MPQGKLLRSEVAKLQQSSVGQRGQCLPVIGRSAIRQMRSSVDDAVPRFFQSAIGGTRAL
jgi:hypothetical protein